MLTMLRQPSRRRAHHDAFVYPAAGRNLLDRCRIAGDAVIAVDMQVEAVVVRAEHRHRLRRTPAADRRTGQEVEALEVPARLRGRGGDLERPQERALGGDRGVEM